MSILGRLFIAPITDLSILPSPRSSSSLANFTGLQLGSKSAQTVSRAFADPQMRRHEVAEMVTAKCLAAEFFDIKALVLSRIILPSP